MASGFDAWAPIYDPMMRLFFGSAIRDCQSIYLHFLPQEAKVLVMGGGSAWIVSEIWKQRPDAQIIFWEISPRMLKQARKRIPREKEKQIIFVTEYQYQPSSQEQFSAIFSHFFLDIFPPQKSRSLVEDFIPFLQEGAYWYYSDFWAEGSYWKRQFIQGMYWVCDLLSPLENKAYYKYSQSFNSQLLKLVEEDFFYGKLIQSQLYQKVKP